MARSTQPAPTFYLGTHQPSWLTSSKFPLFISHKRLARYKRRLPVARCRWALDSGAFSELSTYGRWTVTPEEYVAAVRRYRDEIGRLDWAAPRTDVRAAIVAKTGLSVQEHQRQTVDNYVRLKELAPDLPFIPVLQGWQLEDYLRCVDDVPSRRASIGRPSRWLASARSVAVKPPTRSDRSWRRCAGLGLRLHGFGVKTEGLRRYGQYLASADSMAWSFRGRRIHGCRHRRHGRTPLSEANCQYFASEWRSRVVSKTSRNGRR